MKILNMFKKSVESTVNTEVLEYVKKSSKNYPKEVLEIHHEFEIAADKLVDEAYLIINSKPEVNESKLDRLAKFGFKQVKEFQEGNKILEETKLSKETIDLVHYYKQNYPFNKFITESQVKTICHKYNLVCGDVERFKGFVPDDNLKQIESFNLKDDDKGLVATILNRVENENIFLSRAIIKRSLGYEHIYRTDIDDEYKYAFQRDSSSKSFYAQDRYDLFGLSDKGFIHLHVENSKFKICAPVKDMDISGLELSEGYKLQRKIEIPDPVVLQPVKGGYLVVTAWGDEASDAILVNEINN